MANISFAMISLVGVGLLLLFLVTWLLQYLWNITMPQVFNLKEITYWQAFRIVLFGI